MHATTKEQELRDDIRLLGRLLGDVIRAQEGAAVFDLIEQIRKQRGGETMPVRHKLLKFTLIDRESTAPSASSPASRTISRPKSGTPKA